jgi:hypothetical protein
MMFWELGKIWVKAPGLTEDDAFQSNPERGLLVYRLPAPADVLEIPYTVLYNKFYIMHVFIEVRNNGKRIGCKETAGNMCRVKF